MDSPFSEFVLDPAKCRFLSINVKRELVRELSKSPDSIPEKLQGWSRRDIVEILCAELGRERKYTGLSKQRMLEYLFRVVNGKSSSPGEHVEDKESTPDPNASNIQSPSKRQRKNDNPLQLQVIASSPLTDVTALPTSNARFCQNSACRATLYPEDKFCRRCSCCICFKYDDNKDPSLWLFCSSDQPLQKDSCGLSCHLECALKDERSGILQSGQRKKLDGDYYCIHCGKQNDLLGCWKKQLLVAKDARRLDVLCHRIFLCHKLLISTERYLALHEIVDTAMKKLEAEVGPITGTPNMGRGIVGRLAVGAEVQKLCVRAIETLQSMFSGALPADLQIQRSMVPSNFIKFEDICQTSVTVALDLDICPTLSQKVTGFNLWHRKAGIGDYPSNLTGTILLPLKTLVVPELAPATNYIFKVVALSNSKEFGLWEVRTKTKGCPKEEGTKSSMPGYAPTDPNSGCLKTNSGGLSNPSSEGMESNNNTTVYADLNKSPESDFEYCENPEILHSDKASHNPNEPTHISQNTQFARVTEITELEEAPGLSASALDEEPNSTVQTTLLRESSNSTEHNQGILKQNQETVFPRSENASSAPTGNELLTVPPQYSGSLLTITARGNGNREGITGGTGFKAKSGDHVLQSGPSKLEREPGSSSNKRTLGNIEDIGHKDGCPEASFEYCVKVVRWLECEGYIETNFRMKFLTWFSLRATLHERRIVSIYMDTLIDDPISLASQLGDTFSEAIYSKRLPPVPSGFCMELWH